MTILILTFLTNIFISSCQNLPVHEHTQGGNCSDYTLTLSTFNHAERLFKGTLTYIINDSSITIYNREELSGKDSIIFSKRIMEPCLHQIKTITLNKLENYYNNNCIMPISGSEYDISVRIDLVTKTIHLHHYYQKQIDHLISCMNILLPNEYKIVYVNRNTKQDCE
jgi:hypothetical protein